jgi:signal transduction histidine kinase
VFSLTSIVLSGLVNSLRSSLIAAERFKKAAEQANTAKDHLIATVSHDIRNPLGVISGYAELALIDSDPSTMPTKLQVIQRNSEVCLELLNSLQEFSTVSQTSLQLKKEREDLVVLLGEIILSAHVTASVKGIHIAWTPPLHPCFVEIDKSLLRRAIQNILSNAIKYSPYHSTIRVELCKCKLGCKILIQDQGPGLSVEEQEKIFLPYYRGNSRPTGGETSTGLGLAIVANIIEAHEGRVYVASELGSGSTFIVELKSSAPEELSREEHLVAGARKEVSA